jgi:cobyrinic acid a,c-diamide synthase
VAPGLIIAAPASGQGKTTLTLALLRRFHNEGLGVAALKVGPDYIDPAFHAAASGRTCGNLDSWAMRPSVLARQTVQAALDSELVIAEGVMGLFDGTAEGRGSTAEVAKLTGWPVVLVVDATGMATSAGALLKGFMTFDPGLAPAAVVFNRVASPRHLALLKNAAQALGLPCLGGLPRLPELTLPERHLGLVQAGEHRGLDAFLEGAAEVVAENLDLVGLRALARPAGIETTNKDAATLPPLGQRIAVARDVAFAFCYPFHLEGWQAAGAEISFFSPLADEAPDRLADAVYLPGGYPELHAGKLSGNSRFLAGLRAVAAKGQAVYGECGGYVVLGEGLEDEAGICHSMAGLLPVSTSFARRRRHLGYRRLRLSEASPLGAAGTGFRGHEFHYASITDGERARPLFACEDASGNELQAQGAQRKNVMGSFIHLIDREG